MQISYLINTRKTCPKPNQFENFLPPHMILQISLNIELQISCSEAWVTHVHTPNTPIHTPTHPPQHTCIHKHTMSGRYVSHLYTGETKMRVLYSVVQINDTFFSGVFTKWHQLSVLYKYLWCENNICPVILKITSVKECQVYLEPPCIICHPSQPVRWNLLKVLDQITLENKFCLNFKIMVIFHLSSSSKLKALQICISFWSSKRKWR